MTSQLKIIGVVFALCGVGLICLALWSVYKPLCPGFGGLCCLFFARMAFKEARA